MTPRARAHAFFQVLQVDEIKFDQPVYIDEIRIVPAGYTVGGLEKSATRVGYATADARRGITHRLLESS